MSNSVVQVSTGTPPYWLGWQQTPAILLKVLRHWQQLGWLRRIDSACADFLWREQPDSSPLVLLSVALASHQYGRGHVCLDWAQVLPNPDTALGLPPELGRADTQQAPRPSELLAGIGMENLDRALSAEPVLVAALASGVSADSAPLVWSGARLYLRRNYVSELQIVASLQDRLARQRVPDAALMDLQRQLLASLFEASKDILDWQMVAVALALNQSFAVITGGPGTGKTTAVVRLLAALQWQNLQTAGACLRVKLAAPTGKAAARLNESIGRQLDNVEALLRRGALAEEQCQQVMAALRAEKVSTLHRLLGSQHNTRHFRHHAANPLPADVVVVDEASMIDTEMMSQLLAALTPETRLILIGDKDQLASVEAGAVLGQLCQRAAAGHYSAATAQRLAALTGAALPAELLSAEAASRLDQAIVMLRKSHRFSASSAIGSLAQAVNRGDVQQASAVFTSVDDSVCRLQHLSLESDFRHWYRQQQQAYLQALGACLAAANSEALDRAAQALLQAQTRFQLLAVLREGDWGVDGLNRQAERALGLNVRQQQFQAPVEPWYSGRPVMVTANDYGQNLMNGDIGVCVQRDGIYQVVFADEVQGVRWVRASRLQAVATCYAMTVHKSQGSEFEHTALVLPPTRSPLLTRELLYTAITRAKNRFSLLYSDWRRFDECVTTVTVRASGLAEPLLEQRV